MNKRSELVRVKALVKEILTHIPQTRNSDSYLYLKVLGVFAANKQIDITSMPVSKYLLKMSELGFPPFETVRRTRQKLQREFPELSADAEVKAYRKENEEIYRDFARNEI